MALDENVEADEIKKELYSRPHGGRQLFLYGYLEGSSASISRRRVVSFNADL
ncbi:uncharacterized protein DS421_10g308780 [Arachis hypogaea]|nr:uncharacterized protein DS421_10g308780 [Arachis hypogaea]